MLLLMLRAQDLCSLVSVPWFPDSQGFVELREALDLKLLRNHVKSKDRELRVAD